MVISSHLEFTNKRTIKKIVSSSLQFKDKAVLYSEQATEQLRSSMVERVKSNAVPHQNFNQTGSTIFLAHLSL